MEANSIMFSPVADLEEAPVMMPRRQTSGSAGYDLHLWLPVPVTTDPHSILIQPRQRVLVSTGLMVDHIPQGYELQIRPRSGLAYKQGLTVLNTPGTIDSDYRGELKVLLYNTGVEPIVLAHGERVAQMVIAKYEVLKIEMHHVRQEGQSSKASTDRGGKGFGSTGK